MEKEMEESKFKRICVFCGSGQGNKSSYKDAAVALGKELVIDSPWKLFASSSSEHYLCCYRTLLSLDQCF